MFYTNAVICKTYHFIPLINYLYSPQKKPSASHLLVGSAGFGTMCDGILAVYPDEKTAVDELEKIFAAFESGAGSYRI